MSQNDRLPERPDEDQEPSYTPASPVKRTLAWIALVYVLIVLALTTYYYFTGTTLGNLGPLLAIPGLVGLGILQLVSWRSTGTPSKGVAMVGAVICFAIAVASLPLAVVGLLSNFPDWAITAAVIGGGG
jgi:hypothetical protein